MTSINLQNGLLPLKFIYSITVVDSSTDIISQHWSKESFKDLVFGGQTQVLIILEYYDGYQEGIELYINQMSKLQNIQTHRW